MSLDLEKELWDMADMMNTAFVAQKIRNAVTSRSEHRCEKGHVWVSDKVTKCPFCSMQESKLSDFGEVGHAAESRDEYVRSLEASHADLLKIVKKFSLFNFSEEIGRAERLLTRRIEA